MHIQDRILTAMTLCAVMATLVGCGGGGSYNGSGNQQLARNFVYAASSQANNINAWEIDGTTGRLTAIAGSPFPGLDAPMTIAIDPAFKHIAVTNLNYGKLNMFDVNKSTGALSQVAGSPFNLQGGGYQLSSVFDPHGDYLYVGNSVYANSISVYPVNTSTGAVDTPEVIDSIGLIHYLAIHPSGSYLYSAGSGIAAFNINVGGLAELPGSPFSPSLFLGDSRSVVHPSGNLLLVADRDSGQLRVMALNADGSVGAEVPGSPLALGAVPVAIAIGPSLGTTVFVTTESDTLIAIPINPVSGHTGTPSAPAATGHRPMGITTDSSGTFVYVACQTGGVFGFALGSGPATTLNPLSGSPYVAKADLVGIVATHFTAP